MNLLTTKRLHRLYRSDDGIELLVTQVPGTTTGSVSLWLPCGPFDENQNGAAVAHAFEHVMLSGKVGRFGDPWGFVEGLGGEIEAATYYDYMRFQIRIGAENIWDAIELMTELWVRGPDTGRLSAELETIKEEWSEYADMSEVRVDSAWRYSLGIDALYGGFRDEWMARVDRITARDISDLQKLAEKRGIVLQIVSPSHPDNIRDFIEKSVLHGLPGPSAERSTVTPGDVPISKRGMVLEAVQAPRSYLALGIVTAQGGLASHVCGRVLLTLLCEGAHSRLYRILRNELGLVYDLATDFDQTRSLDIISFSTSFDNTNTESVSNCVRDQILAMANGEFREQEFARAKAYLCGRNQLYCESPYNHGKFMGRHYMATDEFVDSEDFGLAVASVTPEAVTRLLRKVLADGSWAVAVHGPCPQSSKDAWLGLSQSVE
jgi:predicted Zn-dependent peptidase